MAAVTLVVGDEELLVSRSVQRAVGAATAATGASQSSAEEALTVREVEAAELSAASLLDLTSPSLFAEDRVLVVRSLQDAGKETVAALTEFTENPEDGVHLVLVHSGAKAKAVVDALAGAGAHTVRIARIKAPRDREQFVLDEVREAGGQIGREAAADLVAALGADLRELATSCEQLVADVGPQITAADVATYHRGRAESTGFAVADRAVEGNAAAALETLRWAFATGVDPVLVSSSLAANLRLIAVVASAGRGSPDSLAGPLGLPAWKIRRAQGWVRRWRPDALADAVRTVARADADLKGAGDDAAFAVERAVLDVATAVTAA